MAAGGDVCQAKPAVAWARRTHKVIYEAVVYEGEGRLVHHVTVRVRRTGRGEYGGTSLSGECLSAQRILSAGGDDGTPEQTDA